MSTAKSPTIPRVGSMEEKHVRAAWLALIWGLLVAPIIIALIDPSVAPGSEASAHLDQLGADSGSSAVRAMVFGVNILVLGAATGAIIQSTRLSRDLSSGFLLWFAVIALSAGPLLSSLLHTGLVVSPDVLRIPVFFTAAYLLPSVSIEWFAKQCKHVIELYVAATLAAVVLLPSMVIQANYDASVISAASIRLHGIANHANHFAPLLVAYFVLGWIAPARSTYDRAALVVVMMTLVATQSKTAILALGLLYIIRLFYVQGALRFLIAYSTALAAVTGLLLLTLFRPTWDKALIDTFISDSQYTTLTGRTDLWAYSLDLWRSQPILGYGPEAWHIEMTVNHAQRFYWVAYHAHNQLIQTLGVSGIVGMIGLVVFTLVFASKSIQLSRATSGASVALFLFLFVRSFTEVPLGSNLNESFFVFWAAFTLVLLADSNSALGNKAKVSTENKGLGAPQHMTGRTQVLKYVEERRGSRHRSDYEYS